MDIQTFVKHFAAQFDETSPEDITAKTVFRSLEEWSSMTALSVIAFIDEEYQVTITGDDIRSSQTVEDIFNKVVEKTA